MKRFIYIFILVTSFTLVFSQGRPCCKNKIGKGKISCKLNQANIDVKNDIVITDEGIQTTSNVSVKCANSANIHSSDPKKCSGCKNTPWWKFWAKKKNSCNT